MQLKSKFQFMESNKLILKFVEKVKNSQEPVEQSERTCTIKYKELIYALAGLA